jgi:hypothetical protein
MGLLEQAQLQNKELDEELTVEDNESLDEIQGSGLLARAQQSKKTSTT